MASAASLDAVLLPRSRVAGLAGEGCGWSAGAGAGAGTATITSHSEDALSALEPVGSMGRFAKVSR